MEGSGWIWRISRESRAIASVSTHLTAGTIRIGERFGTKPSFEKWNRTSRNNLGPKEFTSVILLVIQFIEICIYGIYFIYILGYKNIFSPNSINCKIRFVSSVLLIFVPRIISTIL